MLTDEESKSVNPSQTASQMMISQVRLDVNQLEAIGNHFLEVLLKMKQNGPINQTRAGVNSVFCSNDQRLCKLTDVWMERRPHGAGIPAAFSAPSLSEPKEIADAAYAIAMDDKAVSLAALLVIAAKKIKTSMVVQNYGCLTESTTIYDYVIREALSLGSSSVSSPLSSSALVSSSLSSRGQSWPSTTSSSNSTGERELLPWEVQLLQLYGAESQRSCADKKGGDGALVEILLKTKIGMNEGYSEGNTTHHCSMKTAPSSSQIKIMPLLLKYGAWVGQINRIGLTTLDIAAANGNSQAFQILLPEDPDGVHTTKETPLYFVVKNDYMDIAEHLLQGGANREVLTLRKQCPVDFANSRDMLSILNPVNISTKKITTPMVVQNAGGLTESATMHDCVIREASSLGSPSSFVLSSGGQSWSSATRSSNSTGKIELSVCEMELLQPFGAVSQQTLPIRC